MGHPRKIAANAVSKYLEKMAAIKNDEYLGELLLYLYYSARILQIDVRYIAKWIYDEGNKVTDTEDETDYLYGIDFNNDAEIIIIDMCLQMIVDIQRNGFSHIDNVNISIHIH
jgi:hypothetical protein